jgi:hypothetical protein
MKIMIFYQILKVKIQVYKEDKIKINKIKYLVLKTLDKVF